MARDGVGNYNLPSPANPVVSGANISSVDFNATMTDLGAALSGSIAADGQTPMTGTLNMNAHAITNAVLTSPTINTPTINSPTIPGTTTNDNAPALTIGEVISSVVGSGASIALTSATGGGKNVTTISLTAGDWDVHGAVYFAYGVATVTGTGAGISLVSAGYPSPPTVGIFNSVGASPGLSGPVGLTTGTVRISIAATTTVYLVASGVYSGGTPSVYGFIEARRAR